MLTELLGPREATPTVAFPLQDEPAVATDLVAARDTDFIHCGLPFRSAGFGFAVDCDALVLASNRKDLRNSVDSELGAPRGDAVLVDMFSEDS